MSNIGKKIIERKEGVEVKQEGDKVIVTGPKGTLEAKIPNGILLEIKDGEVQVKKANDTFELEKFFGLARSLVANMVKGVSLGFEKKLELSGVGYRAKIDGQDLVLTVGFAHPVRMKPLDGVSMKVEENVITVMGINKQFVGDMASKIREVRPPDPYKAKGIKYVGEKIRRKVGKAAKAVGGK